MSVGRENRTAILCLLLALATLAAYNPVTHNGFINFDDGPYITENPHVRAGLTWSTVAWAFTSYRHVGFWFPLTWLSHALDCQLFNLNPVGHHYVSLLFHVVNAVLLFLLLQKVTGMTWRSLAVGALFALHPVNVESVAWAAERKNVISMLFFLLALHAYNTYVRRGGSRRYLMVLFLFTLGLMAKAQIITLPFVLLLWDYWPLQRMSFHLHPNQSISEWRSSLRHLVIEKLPIFALSAGSAIITIWSQHSSDAVRSLADYSFPVRLENAFISYIRYLRIAFWPWHLTPMYPHLRGFPLWEVLGSIAILLLVTVVILRVRKRYLIVGWLWFLGTLVPMIGIVQVGEQAMADRFAYVPFIGLFFLVVWSFVDITKDWKPFGLVGAVASTLIMAILGALTYHQLSYWHDSEKLWIYTLQVTQKNYVAHDNLGRALADQGRVEEAIAQFHSAEELFEYRPTDYLRVGDYEQRNGHPREAIEEFKKVLRLSTDPALRVLASSNLGLAYVLAGDHDLAKQSYEDALRLNPDYPLALIGLGILSLRNGDFMPATDQFSHAMRVQPSDVGFLLLAATLQRAGYPNEAQVAYQQAQRISPDFTRAQRTVELLLSQ